MHAIQKIWSPLTLLLALILAPTASAASPKLKLFSVEASCTGALDVLVINWQGRGLALYVLDGEEVLLSKWATSSVLENSERITRVEYRAGEVREGGASLRIRTRDARLPATEGTAHLTYDGQNRLLQCDTY